MTLTDANGKTFEVTINDIADMTTDLEGSAQDHDITDAEAHKVTDFQVAIVDSQGNSVDVNKLLDEAKQDPARLPKAIDVLFEATHSGSNRNFFIYHSDSMENDATSWKSPFAKPFLKNHDIYSEPLGRVHDFYFGRSEFNPDRDCINVVYRISDADAIEKFLDGRYRTMSIGGSVGHVSCSICGKDILKDGVFKFCGHWRGEAYAGQKALWNARNIEYKEGSVVNAPADDWAQVKKITVITGDAKDSAANTNQKDGEDMSKSVDSNVNDNILDDIDALAAADNAATADGEPNGEPNGETKPEGGEAQDSQGQNEGENADNSTDANDNEPETLEAVKDERDTLKAENQSLKDEKKALEDQVKDLQTQVTQLNDQVRTLTEENKTATEDSQASRKQSIKLAVMNKKLMAQRIVDFELLSNKVTDDKKEVRMNELIAKGAKELTDMVESLATTTIKEQRKFIDQVNNPSMVNLQDQHAITEDDDDKVEDKKDEKKVPTMKDFEDTIIKIMTRK